MKIAIFGLGGVGGYFGGRLSQLDDHKVYFVARGKHLLAIQNDGLYINSELGDFIAHPTLATDTPADIGTVDLVLVATKAWQLPEATSAMQPLIGDDTVILPLLNGVEAPQILGDTLGHQHVLGGFCRVLSHITSPGHITQKGTPPYIALGELNGQLSPRIQQIAELLKSANIQHEIQDNIQSAIWQKLLFIASFGGVGAVTRMPAGILRTQPETRQLLQDSMKEVKYVALALDIPMADNAVEQGMEIIDNLPENALASMQRDILNGRPSELDSQNGAVVRYGEKAQIPTPTHRFIYQVLLPLERASRGMISPDFVI